MAEKLPQSWNELEPLLHRKRVLAIGPGLGTSEWAVSLVRDALRNAKEPMVIDADALNVLAEYHWNSDGRFRVLTPHPGEMSRLRNTSIERFKTTVSPTRVAYSREHNCVVVLKGYRSIIAFPDGELHQSFRLACARERRNRRHSYGPDRRHVGPVSG